MTRLALFLIDRFMEFVIAGIVVIGLAAGIAKDQLDRLETVPVVIAGDMPSPALLPLPKVKP